VTLYDFFVDVQALMGVIGFLVAVSFIVDHFKEYFRIKERDRIEEARRKELQ